MSEEVFLARELAVEYLEKVWREVPTLLLYGDADQRSPLNVSENLHKKIPDPVIMPGVA